MERGITGKDGTLYPNYHTYLQSDEWQTFRQERLKADHHRCVVCGSKEHLNVHHINYMYMHEPDYLVTLCKNCHSRLHQEILPMLGEDLKKLNDKFIPIIEECMHEYEKEKSDLFLSYCQNLNNGKKLVDKGRAV